MYLMSKPLLELVSSKYKLGVPITKIVAQSNLAISRPTVARLIKLYLAVQGTEVEDNFFPEFIRFAEEVEKVNLGKYRFEGKFPYGKWVKKANA